jgi:ligand-binding sensor domain-containing protein
MWISHRARVGLLRVCLLVVLCPQQAAAQALPPTSKLEFTSRRITTADGLPQNSVNRMMLGADGALWLATFGGLSRYDGRQVTVLSSGGAGQLATPRILSVSQAPDGTIWVGSHGSGAGVRERLALRPAPIGSAAETADRENIHDILFDRRGNVWFATDRDVIRRAVDGTTRLFKISGTDSRNEYYDLHEDLDGGIWVTHQEGIARIADDSIHQLLAPTTGPTHPTHVVASDADGTIVVGTRIRGGELLRWDGDRFTPLLVQFLDRSDRIRSLTALPDSAWAIGTDEGRLLIWRPGLLTHVTATHLGRSAITQVLPRPTGGFWLATTTDGLVELTAHPARSLTRDGRRIPSAVSVTTDRAGARWAALGCNGVVRQDRTGQVTAFPLRECVTSILEAENGRIWIGTNVGLFLWAPGEALAQTPRAAGRIQALYHDSDGRLWVGGEGLLLAQRAPGETELRPISVRGGNVVQALHQDANRTLWVGTSNGLFRVRGDTLVSAATPGLPAASVRTLYSDREGRLWAGTYGSGLWIVSDSAAVVLTTSDGLPEAVVSWIGEDTEGNLFLSGNRGVHRVPRQALLGRLEGRVAPIAFLTIGVTDDLEPLEANGGSQPSGLWTDDGSLLFPTIYGPMTIEVARIGAWAQPPIVQVDTVTVDERVQFGDTIVLPPRSQRLDIHFSAVDFDRAASLVYEYRLLPYDSAWVRGPSGRAVFTKLPPGDYTFQAQATNDRGLVSANTIALAITVKPRFTQTAGFQLILLLLAIGTVVGVAWFWSAATRRRAALLEQEVAASVAKLRIITGMLPICAWCRKIRNDEGAWRQFEQYILEHTDAKLTHGMCEECSVTMLAGRSSTPP